MDNILLFCGIAILIIVVLYIAIRLWYHRPTGYKKGNKLYDDRRKDFIDKINKTKK